METEERVCLGGEENLEITVQEVIDGEDGRAGVEAPKCVPDHGVGGEVSFHHLVETPQVHRQPQLQLLVGTRGLPHPLHWRDALWVAGKRLDNSLFDQALHFLLSSLYPV